MLDIIEKLLILQDRDRNINRTQAELNTIAPQRQRLHELIKATQSTLHATQEKVKKSEIERKELELEVEGQQENMERYSNQQMQTKKNEEYQALDREIRNCKDKISLLEDRQLELMEQIEQDLASLSIATAEADRKQAEAEEEIAELNAREAALTEKAEELRRTRNQLTESIDPVVLQRYERLFAKKGDNVVVGIERGVCGGCHMKLPAQEIVSCKQEHDIVSCPNCGRILYYTRDMLMTDAD